MENLSVSHFIVCSFDDRKIIDGNYLHPSISIIPHPYFVSVLVYNEAGCEVADRWRKAADRAGWYVNLKLFPGFRNCPNQPDAWHQYGVDKQGKKYVLFGR